jgi:hypothetical protein
MNSEGTELFKTIARELDKKERKKQGLQYTTGDNGFYLVKILEPGINLSYIVFKNNLLSLFSDGQ